MTDSWQEESFGAYWGTHFMPKSLRQSPGKCNICLLPIPQNIVSEKHPLFGTIDHVRPLSRGGRDCKPNRAPAQKVIQSQWTGEQCFMADRYFDTVDEAVEHIEADGGSTPEYIWAARNQGVPTATSEDIIERLTEEMWEDADYRDLNGVEELEAAIDAFNEANKSVVVWMVDHSTAILVERADPSLAAEVPDGQ